MIRKLYVQNFRMLRSNTFELAPFRLFVGPMASGRSTVLRSVLFLSSVANTCASSAVREIADQLSDLCFDPTRPLAFAIEATLARPEGATIRYELELGPDPSARAGVRINREQLFLVRNPSLLDVPPPVQPALFESDPTEQSILHDRTPRGWRKVVAKSVEGRDYFWDEKTDWHSMFRFGADRSSLGSLPDDPERFPESIALRDFLRDRVKSIAFECAKLRAPSPPGPARWLASDGADLPLAVQTLMKDPAAFDSWQHQLRAALPGLASVHVRERNTDRFLLLEATFDGGHSQPVPSWCLSDELLRIMALTILPHHPGNDPILYLVDEPETGLHPRALHIVFESLNSMPQATQCICCTGSAMLAGRAEREQVIVLRRGPDGASKALSGTALPDKPAWLEPG